MKTYISYVIQSGNVHMHLAEIKDLPLNEAEFYADAISREVLKWTETKQAETGDAGKVIILNFFSAE